MSDRMMHSLLVQEGGIRRGSEIQYFTKEEEDKMIFAYDEGVATR